LINKFATGLKKISIKHRKKKSTNRKKK